MTDRRYDEKDVAEIFRRAAEAQQEAARQLPSGDEGMSLAELQEIARQVGITPDAVADAARSLDRHEPRFRRELLGLTVGVGRTVALDRKVSTEEWERLVGVLRDTFDARGNAKSEGNLRQWTNGNLQILIEPTEHGDRLRMRTVHQAARGMMTLGAGVIGVVTMVSVITFALGIPDAAEKVGSLGGLFGVGIAAFGMGALRLRGWAATRLRQMDEIANRLRGVQPPALRDSGRNDG